MYWTLFLTLNTFHGTRVINSEHEKQPKKIRAKRYTYSAVVINRGLRQDVIVVNFSK